MFRSRSYAALLLALAASTIPAVLPSPAAAATLRPVISHAADLSDAGGSLATGPDGDVWLAERTDPGRVARIGLDGGFTEYTAGATPGFTRDRHPRGMVAGPDGAMWFLKGGGFDAVARITGGGIVSEFGGLTAGRPENIAVGSDGNLWFTQLGGRGAIGRITPAGVVSEYDLGLTPNSDPADIAAGPDGALWFTETAGAGAIGRITTAGVITEFRTGLTKTPESIAAGPDGALWFTQPAGGIGRIATNGVITEYSDGIRQGRAPQDIAAGPDGALWFTEALGLRPAIGRITTDGVIEEFRSGLSSSAVPLYIAPAPDGGMLFTDQAPVVRHITVPPAAGAVTATATSATAATVSGTVTPNGLTATYRVEYRSAGADWQRTAEIGAGNGVAAVPVTTAVEGLAPEATYEVRLVATNDTGTVAGPSSQLTTPAVPAGPEPKTDAQPAPADPAPVDPVIVEQTKVEAAPVPTLGEAVVLKKETGAVKVKVPGGSFVELDELSTIPVGAVIDASRGTVRVRSAIDKTGRSQAGVFRGGRFAVRQPKDGKGMTDLVLRGGDLDRCDDLPRRLAVVSRVTATASAKKKPRRVRRLWGKDSGGRFRTHGRDSVATVLGTRWLTEDRCGGTRVTVAEGAVRVRERATGRTVRVAAGDSHFTKHRPDH